MKRGRPKLKEKRVQELVVRLHRRLQVMRLFKNCTECDKCLEDIKDCKALLEDNQNLRALVNVLIDRSDTYERMLIRQGQKIDYLMRQNKS